MCEAAFSEKGKLTQHFAKYHEGGKDAQGLPLPLKLRKPPTAPGPKPSCDICKKIFRTSDKLKNHIESIHEGKKPYMCDLCGSSFAKTIQLKGHMQSVHEGTKPSENNSTSHQCHLCNVSYSYKYQLTNHMSTIHEEKNPFSCNLCNRSFTALNNLKYHMDAFHGEGVARPHKCSKCDKAFPSRPKLQKHINVVHEGIKPYQCIPCGASFSERSRLKAHLAGKDRFKCKNGVGKEMDVNLFDVLPLNLPRIEDNIDFQSEKKMGENTYNKKSPKGDTDDSTVTVVKSAIKETGENVCPICDSRFSTRFELNRHALSVHEIENLQGFENFGMFSKNDLQQINEKMKESLENRK